MVTRIWIILIISATIANQVWSQTIFNRRFTESVGAFNGVNGPDNTYAVAGQAYDSTGIPGVCFVLVDSLGKLVKSDTLFSKDTVLFAGFTNCFSYSHGYYWLAGRANSAGWVLQLDSDFNVIWDQRIHIKDSNHTHFFSGYLDTTDLSYLVTGETYEAPLGDTILRRKLSLAKFDSAGALQWKRSFFAPEVTSKRRWQIGNYIIPNPKGGYIISGARFDEGNESADGLVVGISDTGGILWEYTIEWPDRQVPPVLTSYDSTSFLCFIDSLTPTNTSLPENMDYHYLIAQKRSYTNGNELGSKRLDLHIPGNAPLDVIPVSDGWIVLGIWYPSLTLNTHPLKNLGQSSYLFKVNKSLDSSWFRPLVHDTLPGGTSVSYDLNKGRNNGSIASGYFSTLSSRTYLWIISTDSVGCTSVACQQLSPSDQHQVVHSHLYVYPNPASSRITIEANGRIPQLLRLYNSFGQLIIEKGNRCELELPAGLMGVYHLAVLIEGVWSGVPVLIE